MDVIELFAGVGGFRLGLQGASDNYNIVWSNQWEPSTKSQDASDIYRREFHCGKIVVDGKEYEEHSNVDINKVEMGDIPPHDMLVGGFPCQDYSVASTLARSGGIEGKKGVLWWSIAKILREHPSHAKYLFLENVDRLLGSPAKQRGRDFAIMLATLSDMGYAVEWRVINAADYGEPQRRRRTYILAYKKDASLFETISHSDPEKWILNDGVMAKALPCIKKDGGEYSDFTIDGDIKSVSDNFNKGKHLAKSPFLNSGLMVGRNVYCLDTMVDESKVGHHTTLGEILQDEKEVPQEYYIDKESLPKWQYLKGAKHEHRVNKATGFEFYYSEGAMSFPDPVDKPSRTIITGEGGKGPSRFKHVVEVTPGHPRRLTPIELERLDGFPDNHTLGASPLRRAFLMGNALVVGIVRRIAASLIENIKEDGAKSNIALRPIKCAVDREIRPAAIG